MAVTIVSLFHPNSFHKFKLQAIKLLMWWFVARCYRLFRALGYVGKSAKPSENVSSWRWPVHLLLLHHFWTYGKIVTGIFLHTHTLSPFTFDDKQTNINIVVSKQPVCIEWISSTQQKIQLIRIESSISLSIRSIWFILVLYWNFSGV